MFGKPPRTGYSMRVSGMFLNRPDMHNIAAELGVSTNDVLTKDGILTVYNTTESCQEIIDDNALTSFVAMALDIPAENITELKEVVEEIVELEFDLSDFDDNDL